MNTDAKTTTAPAKKATVAKKATTTPAKKATVATTKEVKAPKAAKTPAVKKERKSRKGITRSFAEDVTSVVNPVMDVVKAFISNPETSEAALKMLRLELRKSVRSTRGTLNTRKASKA